MADVNEIFTVWITTYALTTGITRHSARISHIPSMVEIIHERSLKQYAHGEGKDWHRTREGAVARAEEMRKAKIASLRKSIAKLEKMTWDAPEAVSE